MGKHFEELALSLGVFEKLSLSLALSVSLSLSLSLSLLHRHTHSHTHITHTHIGMHIHTFTRTNHKDCPHLINNHQAISKFPIVISQLETQITLSQNLLSHSLYLSLPSSLAETHLSFSVSDIHTHYLSLTHTHTHIPTHTHTCTHTMEYYSAIKENGIFPFATMWIDLEGIMLSEISQTEKNKYCMISLICGI